MILTVDIGNSVITIGGFDMDSITFVSRISTSCVKTADEYAVGISDVLKLYGVDKNKIEGAIVASVVPPLNTVIKEALHIILNKEPIFVGPGVKSGIVIQCDIPSSVGADLITASVAAHYIYGSPCLIVDMDTVTKITYVNSKGAFAGTVIVPGVLMGLDALTEKTAQLPKISLEEPKSVIGKNTVDCMRSGAIYGNASMIDGMIDRICEEIGEELKVLATGAMSSLITPKCKHDITLDEHLVLKGLNILYRKNKVNL
jgi:type III pantothenate kinase